jgi:hypothetical protein
VADLGIAYEVFGGHLKFRGAGGFTDENTHAESPFSIEAFSNVARISAK